MRGKGGASSRGRARGGRAGVAVGRQPNEEERGRKKKGKRKRRKGKRKRKKKIEKGK
jgi:hypothetical protein